MTISIPKNFPLHLQPRSDSEIRDNCKWQMNMNVALSQYHWDLACRGSYPGSTGVDWRLDPPQAIAALCQQVWTQLYRFYDHADVYRWTWTTDNYGGVVRQKLITKTVDIGLLDYREIRRRGLSESNRINALVMDLVDAWGKESPDFQRALISQMARS
jgi:hypothetical protein